MTTLKNHIILYDSECPMCKLYTHAFTTGGMLDKNGRAPYQEMPAAVCPFVDRQRAVNEIALVNTQTGEVKYGIESLFTVIANAYPLFRPLFSCKPFAKVMRKAYAFISYNRKVIIPAPVHVAVPVPGGFADATQRPTVPQPSFSLRYRIAYLIFTWIAVGGILTAYAPLLTGMLPLGSPYREYLICGGQVFFQGAVLTAITAGATRSAAGGATRNYRIVWDYLGNMMTISFAGALLLLPAVLAAKFIHPHPLSFTLYFLAVAGLMFIEHIRRTKLLGLGWLPTVTWTIYRLLLLGLILTNVL